MTAWFKPRSSHKNDGASHEEPEAAGSVLHLIRDLSRLRHGHPALANGEIGKIFHRAWFPEYVGAQLIFWSDGRERQWKDATNDNEHIQGSVLVPPFGLVVLKRT